MKQYPIALTTLKKYLNIAPDNNSYDELLNLLMDASYTKIELITGRKLIVNDPENETSESNSIIDIAVLKDIATNFKNRENESDVPVYSMDTNTKKLIIPYIKQIAY